MPPAPHYLLAGRILTSVKGRRAVHNARLELLQRTKARNNNHNGKATVTAEAAAAAQNLAIFLTSGGTLANLYAVALPAPEQAVYVRDVLDEALAALRQALTPATGAAPLHALPPAHPAPALQPAQPAALPALQPVPVPQHPAQPQPQPAAQPTVEATLAQARALTELGTERDWLRNELQTAVAQQDGLREELQSANQAATTAASQAARELDLLRKELQSANQAATTAASQATSELDLLRAQLQSANQAATQLQTTFTQQQGTIEQQQGTIEQQQNAVRQLEHAVRLLQPLEEANKALQEKNNACQCGSLRSLAKAEMAAKKAQTSLKTAEEKLRRRTMDASPQSPPARAELPLPAPAWSHIRLLDAFTLDNDLANSTRHGLWRRVVAAYEDTEDETDKFLACYPRPQDGVRVLLDQPCAFVNALCRLLVHLDAQLRSARDKLTALTDERAGGRAEEGAKVRRAAGKRKSNA